MRILLILGALIVGTIAFFFLLSPLWDTIGSISIIVAGIPGALAACAFLGTKGDDGSRPSLRNGRTWFALLGLGVASVGLMMLGSFALIMAFIAGQY